MKLEVLRRPSLAARLVLLAAGWSLTVLLISAVVLSLLFQQAALRRFDQGLSELVDNLMAGTTVGARGQVLAPALLGTQVQDRGLELRAGPHRRRLRPR